MYPVKRIEVDCDLSKNNKIPSLRFQQGDEGNSILVIRVKNKGLTQTLSEVTDVRGYFVKSDKKAIEASLTVTNAEAGLIEYTLPEQLLLIPGLVVAELRLFYGNTVITSQAFGFHVAPSIAGNGQLTQSINDIQFYNDFKELQLKVDSIQVGTGQKGEKGDKGEPGLNGLPGIQGPKGDTGATGPQGAKGDTGSTGAQGLTGPAGPKGDKGDTGATGTQGIQGLKGDKGDTGTQGIQGVQGVKGDVGATGPAGPQGAPGINNSPEIKEIARKYKEGSIIDTFKMVDWARMLGNVESDTTYVRQGTESIRMTSSTAGEQPFIRSSRTLKLQGTTNVKLTVYLHTDPADIDGIALFLSNNTGFTNMLSYTFPGISLVKGWNRLVIPISRMTVTGTGSVATDMLRAQIRLIPLAGKIGSLTVDSLMTDTKQQANVIFTFDDQWDSQYSVAFSEMRMRGLKGTIGVNGINVGVPNYMTWAQLEEVYGYGWDLVNHTNEHYNLGQQSYAVQKKDIVDGRAALNTKGFTRASNILFYPYGSYNDTTLQILNEEGIEYARTIREHLEYPAPIQPQTLKIKNLLPYMTAALAQAQVDDAIATGGTIIFLNHRFGTEDESGMFWDITKFQTLLNYVKTKQVSGDVNVLTMSEWLKTFK